MIFDNLKRSERFDVKNFEEFELLKKYGKPSIGHSMARIQKGEYEGPGRYVVLSYLQRCPRNCCWDNVHEVLSIEKSKDRLIECLSELKEIFELLDF